MEAVLRAHRLCLTHHGPNGPVAAVRDVSLGVAAGETVALVGRSGSGKTSLLMALGLLATPDAGTVLVEGRDTAGLGDAELSALRRDRIGFVFQAFNLLPQFTAEENVAMAHRSGLRGGAERAARLLGDVGLGHRLRHRPHQLSAGEQQRVAIARALVNEPAVVLADEPTGNLDAETESDVLDVLTRGAAGSGCAVLLVTHSGDVAARAGRVLRMADGVCAEDAERTEPRRAAT
ncbi:ABC transporter ATP-binding protein [Streptomyces sp. t39]|uniref:ABC transporter ATP-binding protein n=1 Tax=Streptomyces sp. t39 TaxID=1828156 RepID=UPI0011CE302F|nr:ABC transporter ATP-binding protein [Streptomyces sp. t39]TXS56059.1 ABC transporter ATP-binding protein [Streptomyces sp. t39]